jgi:hypothetical protein
LIRTIPVVLLVAATVSSGESPSHYRPKLRTPEALEPFLPHLTPGGDSFPEEREAEELAARLAELGTKLRQSPRRAADVVDVLLAPAFRGGRLQPVEEVAVARHPSLQIFRAGTIAQDLVLDARSFAEQLRGLVAGFREVTVAEFLITRLAVDRETGIATTEVRYDIAGPGTDAFRVGRSGLWHMRWRRGDHRWRVIEWTAAAHLRSRAAAPVFAEVSAAAL